jgi:hypothetical protein
MARPLIKKDQKGVLYARPPSVEAKIDAVSGQNDWAAVAQRARVTDQRRRTICRRNVWFT